MSSDQNYLRPQRHDKERIRPLKNITYIMPLVEVKDTYTESAESNIQKENQFQSNSSQQLS
jgi:hypothetical protein